GRRRVDAGDAVAVALAAGAGNAGGGEQGGRRQVGARAAAQERRQGQKREQERGRAGPAAAGAAAAAAAGAHVLVIDQAAVGADGGRIEVGPLAAHLVAGALHAEARLLDAVAGVRIAGLTLAAGHVAALVLDAGAGLRVAELVGQALDPDAAIRRAGAELAALPLRAGHAAARGDALALEAVLARARAVHADARIRLAGAADAQLVLGAALREADAVVGPAGAVARVAGQPLRAGDGVADRHAGAVLARLQAVLGRRAGDAKAEIGDAVALLADEADRAGELPVAAGGGALAVHAGGAGRADARLVDLAVAVVVLAVADLRQRLLAADALHLAGDALQLARHAQGAVLVARAAGRDLLVDRAVAVVVEVVAHLRHRRLVGVALEDAADALG